jgi:carboxymethylenebutenolidase
MRFETTTTQVPVPGHETALPIYQARPVGEQRAVGVIVAHELFGVNPDIRGVVDRLAGHGYLAIAPEFYHRNVPAGLWLQRDDAGRQQGFELLHKMTRSTALADAGAAVDHLCAQPGIDEVAIIGFSAGGHLAYLAASQLPICRTVVLYGGWLPSADIPISTPTPTLSLTPQIIGRLLYLVGGDDELIPADQVGLIEQALKTAGVDHEVVSYPGAAHAYFWPSTPAYDAAATAASWTRIFAFLDDKVSARPADR